MEAEYYSEGLRLRANYLIYTLDRELNERQKTYLRGAEIPWAEYADCSPIAAVVLFLRSVNAGAYLPELSEDLNGKVAKVCVFLLDPHLIDDFETEISKKRQGVLIRRPILANLNFRETIQL